MVNNSISFEITVQSWSIPLHIVLIFLLIITITLSCIYLLVIIKDKTCHTVSMMHVANLCLSISTLAIVSLGNEFIGIGYDYAFISYPHSSCFILMYIVYAQCSVISFALFLQAFHRYLCIVHPFRIFYQSWKCQLILISFTWILGFLSPLLSYVRNDFMLDVDNEACIIPFRLSFPIIYLIFLIYLFPSPLLMITYFQIIRYVKQISQRITPANVLLRTQRDLEMVRRTVVLFCILVFAGFPDIILLLISFFTAPPKYYHRIGFSFIIFSLPIFMMMLFAYTDSIRSALMKRMRKRKTNRILPTIM